MSLSASYYKNKFKEIEVFTSNNFYADTGHGFLWHPRCVAILSSAYQWAAEEILKFWDFEM